MVPATIDLAGAEIELVSVVARESRLRKAIHGHPLVGTAAEAGEERFDYVLVDCPPSLGLLTLNALVAGNEMMIPIQAEYYALEGLGQLIETVEMVRAHLNPALEVSTILVTMYDARTRLAAGVAEEVREHFGDQVLKTTIPRSVRVSEAPSYGQTVMTYDPGSPGALSYLEAAREIATKGAPSMNAANRPPQRRGLGRGLGSLIPTGPADRRPAAPPTGGPTRPSRRRPAPTSWRRSPGPTSPSCRSTRSRRTGCSRARSSTRRRWPSWCTRSARSGCSSRSSCAGTGPRTTSWSWASAGGAPRSRPASSTVPAIVRETDDVDMLRDALLENLHRSQLNPLEEAAAYQQMLDDFGCTHEELAARIGRSRPQISNTLRLLKLTPAVQRRVAAGVLSAGPRPGAARRSTTRTCRTGSPSG